MKFFSKILNKINFSNFDIFSLGNFAIVYYFIIFYLMPILAFLGASIKFVPASSIIPYKALEYATIGLIFFIVGYFNKFPLLISKKLLNPFKNQWSFSNISLVFSVTFILGLISKAARLFGGGYMHIEIESSFVQGPFYNLIGGLLDWFSYIALAIAFIAYFHFKKIGDQRYKKWCYVAWGAFLLELFYALPSCGRMQAIIPFIIYLIVRWYVLERNFWRILIVMGIVIIFLFPLGNACRTPQALIGYQITSTNEQAILIKDQIAQRPLVPLVLNSSKFAADSFLSRINQSSVLSAIINHPQPLEYGKSFREILMVFTPPRFIWRNKPLSINASSNEFGHRIGLLSDDDFITGVGPTVVGDWYMNFGLAGIIFGMFFMGMLFCLIYEYLIKRTEVSLSGVMIYCILWLNIIKGMEDWIAPVYAGLVKIFILLLIVHYFLIKRGEKLKTL